MGKYPNVPRKLFFLFFYEFRKCSLFTMSLFEMGEISWVEIQDSDAIVMNLLHSSSIYEDTIYSSLSYSVSL